MKTLIVYYSLEGNTQVAAERIAEKTGADLLRLVPKKAYKDKGLAKFLWGGKSALMAEKPPLQPYDTDLNQYDNIIFGFPVWAGNFTPPLRTFILENSDLIKGKKISAFACQSGAGAEKAFSKLAAALGIDTFEETAVFIDPKAKQSADTDAKIDIFCKKIKLLQENEV